MLRLAFACSLSVIGVGLPSQSVHYVGPGGHPDIDAALAVASPGDVLEVEPAVYPPFHATIGVTIRALPSAVTSVSIQQVSTAMLPSGQQLTCSDLRLGGMQLNGGRAVFDRCVLANNNGPSLSVTGGAVHLTFTDVYGNNQLGAADALIAVNSDVTAVHCTMQGFFGLVTSAAVRLVDSRLHASDCYLQGGSGFTAFSPALRLQGAAAAWISDSRLYAFMVCAIETSGQPLRLDRCDMPGSAGCPGAAATGALLGVVQPAVPVLSQPFALEYRFAPAGLVVVFVGFGPATTNVAPLLEQPSWLDGSQFAATLLTADASGLAPVSFAMPSNPTLRGRQLWFQGLGLAATGSALPLQTSPLAGGVAR